MEYRQNQEELLYIKEYADQLKKNEYEESSEEENAKERLSLFKTSTIHSKKVNKFNLLFIN